MLKAGSIILTICSSFNFVLAASIHAAITVFKRNAPILFIMFDEADIPGLDSRILATTRALAVHFNSSVAGLSLLSVFVVWCALVKGQYWAFWALLLPGGSYRRWRLSLMPQSAQRR